MSLAAQRAALQAMLEGIADIGVVHGYERWAVSEQRFRELFLDGARNRICGWTITREATPEAYYTSGQSERQHVHVLRGVRSLDDGAQSETEFQDLLEAICAALRNDPTLAGTAEGDSGPPQVRIVEPRLFHGTLCHYAEITFVGREIMERA